MGLLLLTALAGGVGGAGRFLVDTLITRSLRASVPIGTVVVNVSACFLIGAITGFALAHEGSGDLRTVIGVGLIGGYSTFSTASVEALGLIVGGRWKAGVAHAGGMLLGSMAASTLGLLVGNAL